ncbi:MAG: c-type cytochrome [Stellaceae bacterium]
MKMLQLGVALGVIFLLTAGARAQDASQLAQGKGCLGCHAVDQKKVGPSFKDIAAKYKGQSDAAAKLAAELKNGTGHMKINATDAELQQLIAYVLATP